MFPKPIHLAPLLSFLYVFFSFSFFLGGGPAAAEGRLEGHGGERPVSVWRLASEGVSGLFRGEAVCGGGWSKISF